MDMDMSIRVDHGEWRMFRRRMLRRWNLLDGNYWLHTVFDTLQCF